MISKEIKEHLCQDPVLRRAVESADTTWPERPDDLYTSLIRAIVYQQLSGKAASTIHRRFLQLFPDGYPYPDAVLGLDIAELRSVGLSRQKASYVQNVAEFFQQENLLGSDLKEMDDEAIIKYLTRIKGVGRWTVEMILMFTLNRPDVFPLDDLGIQQAMQRLYELEGGGRQLKNRMLEIAEAWRPYRTYASLCLWRWKDA